MIDYRLYLVTERYDYTDATFFKLIEQACQAGVTLVQLREKSGTTHHIYQLAQKIKSITDQYSIPLIIDDRLDVCLAVNAAGLHIGDDELPVDVVRQLIGPEKILGVSAKTLERAKEAEKLGADYLGVGAIFPTKTKITPLTKLSTLQEICRAVQIPVVAIGGIKTDKVTIFKKIEISGIALVSEIMQANNVEEKVEKLRNELTKIMEKE